MTSDRLYGEPANGSSENRIDLKQGRRAFMQSVGLGMAGAAMFAPSAITSAAAQSADPQVNDLSILNFALNLEYLEAEFYLRATRGEGLSDNEIDGRGKVGGVRGGRKVDFKTPEIREIAQELAEEERIHVRFIRDALGANRVARPLIDLNKSFEAAARAAGLGGNFDPYADEVSFLLAAFIFEDVGVSAYRGASTLINDKSILFAAAGLLGAEAYHAGAIRTKLFDLGQREAVQKISNARDSLDGRTNSDQGIGNRKRGNVSATDNNGLVFARNTRQVLNIVYLDKQASQGGFFPQGMNGALSS